MANDDQRGTARIAVVGALVVIASFVAGKAARDAILLSNFEVTQLPLFVGLSAVASLPLIVLVGRLLASRGPRRLVPALNAVSAVLLVGEWLLFSSAPQVGAAVIFFHLTAFGAVLVSGFWSVVNERFDARTAKRHIGRIGVGATIGGIVGGLIAERAAVYLAPSAILLVLAGLQLTCAVIQHVLQRDGAPSTAKPTPVQSRAALKIVVETPLLRNLAFIVVLGAVAATAIDYVFKVEIVAATGDEGPLRFFAIYYTVTNVLTALAQILLGRTVITRLGVAQSIATLPATVTTFGVAALALPGLTAIVIARSAEMIVRSSVYRAAYELVYAPLAEQYKRSTKVILDVGAERIGDLVGAQLVGLLVYAAAPSAGFLMVGVVAAACALGVALLLPRSYTKALEQSLLVRAPDEMRQSVAWSTVGMPVLSDAGDLTAMSLLDLRASSIQEATRESPTSPAPAKVRDVVLDRIADLRSSDTARVKRALGSPLTIDLVAHVVPLLAWDQVASDATAALRVIAPRCSGVLVDTLLDTAQEFAVRRRLPAILEVGEHTLAAWGLWRGLADHRFEVRYRCAKALSHLRAAGHELAITEADVFAAVTKELSVDHTVWQNHRLLDPSPGGDDDEILLDRVLRGPTSRGLEHVFTVLGLALPTGPVKVALQALCTTDRTLRGTALEYLESALPPEIRALLWPHVEPSGPADDELEVSMAPQDEAEWQRLWAAIEAPLGRIVAQPGFLGRHARSDEDCKTIVRVVMAQLRADNHSRLQMYFDARKDNPRLRFVSWLRQVAKRAGIDYLRKRSGNAVEVEPAAPTREEIAAELMLSHASILADLRGRAEDDG